MLQKNTLPYQYNDLEPVIDAKTVEIHYEKHHQTYVDNANNLINGTDFENLSLMEIIKKVNAFESSKVQALRNNAGGIYNHNLYWEQFSKSPVSLAEGSLLQAINSKFGDFENLKNELINAGITRFGSGWSWLIKNETGELEVVSTPNQDNPEMDRDVKSLLGIDVWEHAYYLNYQNRRPDYLKAIFDIVDWSVVEKRYN